VRILAWFLLAAALIVAGLGVRPATAGATTLTDDQIGTVEDFVYTGAGQDLPPVEARQATRPTSEVGRSLLVREADASPEVKRGILRLLARTDLIRGAAFIGEHTAEIWGAMAGAPEAFWAGWRIGTAIDGRWIHQRVNVHPAPYSYGVPVFHLKDAIVTNTRRDSEYSEIRAPDDLWAWNADLVAGPGTDCNAEMPGDPGPGNEILAVDTMVCQKWMGYPYYWVPTDGTLLVPVQRLDLEAPQEGDLPPGTLDLGTDSSGDGPPPTTDAEARSRIAGQLTDHPDDYPGCWGGCQARSPTSASPRWRRSGPTMDTSSSPATTT
jgi:hypothetical protein